METFNARMTRKLKFQIEESEVLSGKSGQYLIEKFLGEGTYGKVAQCLKLDTNEKMAVKIVRKDISCVGQKELAMLKKLRKLDGDKNNLVWLNEHFMHRGHVCLVFDMLDRSLHDLMKDGSCKLHLSEVRVIAQQMLVALKALKSIGLVHSDIKPDNIMLVKHQLQPFKLKLIDFGLTRPVSQLRMGTIIQALSYRAPEVMLGLPLNEPVDMWALGCVLAFLYLGQHLYPARCEYDVMRAIVQMQGQPDDHMLNTGIRTAGLFTKDPHSPSPSWRLNSPAEYSLKTGCETKECRGICNTFTSLDEMVKSRPGEQDATAYEDTQAFLSLVKRMLTVDRKKRITPSEALGHRFITMKHFHGDNANESYVTSAHLTMKDCGLEPSSDESKCFVTSSEVISWDGASVNSLDEETAAGDNEPPATADRTTAGSDDEPPAAAGLDVPPGTDMGASPASDEAVGLVEVKTRKKWLKRIQGFFSRLAKSMRFC